jgi:hypothetical protein
MTKYLLIAFALVGLAAVSGTSASSKRVRPGITTVKFQLVGEGPARLRGNLPTLKAEKLQQGPPQGGLFHF